MKLYILGNGFDLSHNLPTQYANFIEWLKKGNKDQIYLLNQLEEMFQFHDNWKNFEEALDCPDEIAESKYKKIGYESLFSDDLKSNFSNWSYSIKNTGQFKDIKKIFNFDKNAYFISFNYTPVLESDVYSIDIDHILHIHGYDINHYFFDDAKIEVGHGNKNVFNGQSKIAIELYKDTHKIYERNKDFFDKLQFVNEIITIGFSFSLIDRLYFEKLKMNYPFAKWKFGLYSKDVNAFKNCEIFVKTIGIEDFKTFYYDKDDLTDI